jgi:hypothetical protein
MEVQPRLSKRGDALLCGVRTPSGEPLCPGKIATLSQHGSTAGRVFLPPGVVLGEDGIYDLTARNLDLGRCAAPAGFRRPKRRVSEGVRIKPGEETFQPSTLVELPFRRRCPHPRCRRVAIVDSDVLPSPQLE